MECCTEGACGRDDVDPSEESDSSEDDEEDEEEDDEELEELEDEDEESPSESEEESSLLYAWRFLLFLEPLPFTLCRFLFLENSRSVQEISEKPSSTIRQLELTFLDFDFDLSWTAFDHYQVTVSKSVIEP